MSDAAFLAGRSSGKESDKVNWLNKAEWDFYKAWRHKAETKLHVFGFQKGSSETELIRFNKEYAEKFQENHKILNNE